jgi:hypothetical protein
VVDHDPEFMSGVFWPFVKGKGSCLIMGLARHKDTNGKVEWVQQHHQ